MMSIADYNHTEKLNCSEFGDNYEILMNFPFPIIINPMTWPYPMPTYAVMDENGTYVQTIRLSNESHVPPSVFCLRQLESLTVFRTPFLNGTFTLVWMRQRIAWCYIRRCGSWLLEPTDETRNPRYSWYFDHWNDRQTRHAILSSFVVLVELLSFALSESR